MKKPLVPDTRVAHLLARLALKAAREVIQLPEPANGMGGGWGARMPAKARRKGK